MFLALSRNDSFVIENLLKSYIALGPVAYVGNCKSLFLKLLGYNYLFIDTIITLGIE